MYPDLRSFMAALDAVGELTHIRDRVNPVLEIAQRADRESKSRASSLGSQASQRTDPRFCHLGGRALLFENVAGSDMPVLINGWGSYRRMEMALGCHEHAARLAPHHTSQGAHHGPHNSPPTGFEAIAARLAALVKPEPPNSLREALSKARQLLPLLRVPPKRRRGLGPCQQVQVTGDHIDCTRLPIIKCWPLDGDLTAVGYPADVNDHIAGLERGPDWDRDFRGRYITLAGIHTIHADDRDHPKPPSHNIGMYRVQLLGKRRLAMHWHMHHDGARHWRSWKALGKPMPVAIVFGGESVLPYAATCPLPPGMSELLMAGFLNNAGIPMVRARTVPLWVPANAEIVIEGWVSHEAGLVGWEPRAPSTASSLGGADLRAAPLGAEQHPRHDGASPHLATSHDRYAIGLGAVFEGPFGDHTGFYSMPDRYPLVDVTAITHRRDPIYPTTIVGLPPQEDYFLGKATERIMLPLLKTIVHDVEDYDLPMFGAFHNCAAVQIKKSYPFQARRMMHSVWGAGQMAWTKTIIVVDHDVDVHDTFAVLRAVGEHCNPSRDTELVRGPIDILDHAAPFLGAGAKFGLDATRKWAGAETHRHLEGLAAELCKTGPIPAVLGDAARAAERRIKEIPQVLDARIPAELGGWWLLVRIDKQTAKDGERVIKALGAVANDVSLPAWTILVGRDADLADLDDALFHWQANMAPDRDRYLSVCGRRVAFDSTPKLPGDDRYGLPVRPWPPVIEGARRAPTAPREES